MNETSKNLTIHHYNLTFFFFFFFVLGLWVCLFLWAMPSSPKSFYGRPSPPLSSRRSAFIIVSCLLIGVSGFLFGIASLLWPIQGYRCSNSRPRSVRVVWEHGSAGAGGRGGSGDGIRNDRHKVMGFVGIQTGFGSVGRRHSLRKTWFPSDRQGLERYWSVVMLCEIRVCVLISWIAGTIEKIWMSCDSWWKTVYSTSVIWLFF